MASNYKWPGDTGPGSAPPGWDHVPVQQVGSEVLVALYECERIAWGPFVRGPIRLLVEAHTRFEPPPACAQGRWNRLFYLESMWFDDVAVASWVAETYGATVHVGKIEHSEAAVGEYRTATWTWGEDGAVASSLSFSQASNSSQFPNLPHVVARFLFASEAGNVTALTFDILDEGSQLQQILTPGEMHPPMLYAQATPNPYLGIGNYDEATQLSATMERWSDLACEHPL